MTIATELRAPTIVDCICRTVVIAVDCALGLGEAFCTALVFFCSCWNFVKFCSYFTLLLICCDLVICRMMNDDAQKYF